MELLGIGPLELIAILLIIFVVMGPSDIVKMANTLGRTLRNLRRSEMWKAMQRAQREIRTLPDTLARQAEFEDLKQVKEQIEKDLSAPKKEIESLDRELVAWTRTEGQKAKSDQEQAPEKSDQAGSTEKNEAGSKGNSE